MCLMSCLLPLVVPTCSHCPQSPVPLSPLEINRKGVYPREFNVFDVVSLTSSSSHCPLSPVHCPPLKIKPKGVYPMESNVFDVVLVVPTVPSPLSPVPRPPLKINSSLKVCIQWGPMCLMSCLLPLVVPTCSHYPLSPVPRPLSPLKINPKGVYPMESNVFDDV